MDKQNDQRTFRFPMIAFPWALATAFVLLIGWFRNINLLLLFGYLLAAIPLLNALAAGKPLRGLRAKRRIARPIYAGLPCAVSVQVIPAGAVRLGVRIEDVGPAHRLNWFLVRLEREGRTFRGQVVISQRGRYLWGPLLAWSGYPFGLVYRRVELTPAEEVVVLPRLGRLHRGLFRRHLRSAASDQDRRWRQPRRHAAAQEQFHGLRPYRAGDNPRAVHWRTSARRGEWMVREFEDLPGENLLLIFDPLLPGANSQRDFEAAVSLAATIAAEWRSDHGGRLIVVVANDDPVMLDGAAGSVHVRRVLEGLAVVEPLSSHGNFAAVLDRLKAAPSAAVVVVGVGRGDIADAARHALGRPVAYFDAARLADLDFYEPPADPMWKQ
jgi:uncharacterized protein (DUF58 family)